MSIDLPGAKTGAKGHPVIDPRAIFALAFPLFLNCVIQAVLNVTDNWFVGRLSTEASAALGAANWPTIISILLGGCTSLGVQTLVAQAYGAGRLKDAAAYTWAAMAASVMILPLFVTAAFAGPWLFASLGLPDPVAVLAAQYWQPRLLGGVAASLLWAVTGFFNGVGRTRLDLALMAVVALINIPLNQLFIFGLGLGIGGAAWATNVALLIGVILGFALFLRHRYFSEFATRTAWRGCRKYLPAVFAVGFPIGAFFSVDLSGLALFQLMITRAGASDGAATQIVMSLTSIAYWPALGIAMAGITLVGQSIGRGRDDWAFKLGNTIGMLTTIYMGIVGLVLALAAPWIVPAFINATDPNAAQVLKIALTVIWIAGGYQLFDGVNLGFGGCLRGAGDVLTPTALLVVLSLGIFLPLTHYLTFAPGEGWLPQLTGMGWGAVGGWMAAFVYSVLLGSMMWWRWRSGRWKSMALVARPSPERK